MLLLCYEECKHFPSNSVITCFDTEAKRQFEAEYPEKGPEKYRKQSC